MKIALALWHYIGFTLLSIVLLISSLKLSIFSEKEISKFLETHPLEEELPKSLPLMLEQATKTTLSSEKLAQTETILKEGLKPASLTPYAQDYFEDFIHKFNTPNEDPLTAIFPGEKIKGPALSILKAATYVQISALPVCTTSNIDKCRPSFISVEQMLDEAMRHSSLAGIEKELYNRPTSSLIPEEWAKIFYMFKNLWDKLLYLNRILIGVIVLLFFLSVVLMYRNLGEGLSSLGKKFLWYSGPVIGSLIVINFLLPLVLYRISNNVPALKEFVLSAKTSLLEDFGTIVIIKTNLLFGAVFFVGLILYVIGKLLWKPAPPKVPPPATEPPKNNSSDLTSIYPMPKEL